MVTALQVAVNSSLSGAHQHRAQYRRVEGNLKSPRVQIQQACPATMVLEYSSSRVLQYAHIDCSLYYVNNIDNTDVDITVLKYSEYSSNLDPDSPRSVRLLRQVHEDCVWVTLGVWASLGATLRAVGPRVVVRNKFHCT